MPGMIHLTMMISLKLDDAVVDRCCIHQIVRSTQTILNHILDTMSFLRDGRTSLEEYVPQNRRRCTLKYNEGWKRKDEC